MIDELFFRLGGKTYSCEALVDNSEFPCLVFVKLTDKELILKYGPELTIKTDFEDLLSRTDDAPALTILRQVLLDALKMRPEWMRQRILRDSRYVDM
ncbi:MAG: hypothetical protein EOP49_23955 [Sphingobacteriales bacterium]|nr:MAG: hypothetical protein EOP49_23955 [Sphingobacteriales bacterium]